MSFAENIIFFLFLILRLVENSNLEMLFMYVLCHLHNENFAQVCKLYEFILLIIMYHFN